MTRPVPCMKEGRVLNEMQKNHLKNVLRGAPEPPTYLIGRILRSIEREERKRTYRQVAVSGGFLFASLGFVVASMADLGADLARSGFLSFASLFRSDFSFAMANIKELALSLVESFPAISAAFCLASIGCAIWFGVRLINDTRVARHQNGFATPSFS